MYVRTSATCSVLSWSSLVSAGKCGIILLLDDKTQSCFPSRTNTFISHVVIIFSVLSFVSVVIGGGGYFLTVSALSPGEALVSAVHM
jgi:hypothetical protein